MRRRSSALALLAVVVVAVGALVAAGCGSDGPSTSGSDDGSSPATTGAPAPSPLAGSWTLSGYVAEGREVAAAPSPAVLDLAEDGTFAGTTGCNQLSGTWTGTPDGAFTITPGPMTQMACADPSVDAQEAALTAGLPTVARATVADESLTMADAAGAELFTWARASDDLVGTWSVTGVNDGGGAVVGSAAVEAASITFAPDGTVSGTTGCNSFSGTYTVDGTSLSIDGQVAMTMMACGDDAQQVEQQFVSALDQVASWQRTGPTATLRDPAGATQLTLRATS